MKGGLESSNGGVPLPARFDRAGGGGGRLLNQYTVTLCVRFKKGSSASKDNGSTEPLTILTSQRQGQPAEGATPLLQINDRGVLGVAGVFNTSTPAGAPTVVETVGKKFGSDSNGRSSGRSNGRRFGGGGGSGGGGSRTAVEEQEAMLGWFDLTLSVGDATHAASTYVNGWAHTRLTGGNSSSSSSSSSKSGESLRDVDGPLALSEAMNLGGASGGSAAGGSSLGILDVKSVHLVGRALNDQEVFHLVELLQPSGRRRSAAWATPLTATGCWTTTCPATRTACGRRRPSWRRCGAAVGGRRACEGGSSVRDLAAFVRDRLRPACNAPPVVSALLKHKPCCHPPRAALPRFPL